MLTIKNVSTTGSYKNNIKLSVEYLKLKGKSQFLD